jgi:hypothetical protein
MTWICAYLLAGLLLYVVVTPTLGHKWSSVTIVWTCIIVMAGWPVIVGIGLRGALRELAKSRK